MTEIIFRPAAERELREAYGWYEARAAGLGGEFLQRVDACIQTIRQHPEISPVIYRQIRQGLLKRFPYSLLYVAAKDRVTILSVFHASRDPEKWRRRA